MSEPIIQAELGFVFYGADLLRPDFFEMWMKPDRIVCVESVPPPKRTQWTVSEFERMIAGERE